MATAKEKEKARAAADAAKKGKSGDSKKSASASFNYKAWGISDDNWKALGSEGQASVAVLSHGALKTIEKNQPLPEMLDKKEMDKLWQQAESDPVIQKTFGEEMTTAKDYLNKNIDLISSDFQSLTKQEQQQYIDAKKNIDETQAAAGTAYSGFRTQAQQKADSTQASVVQSSKSTLQKQLDSLQSTYEQRFGSKALADLNIKGIGGYTGDLVGGAYTGAGFGTTAYNPTGNVGGTQAQDILAAKLTKQQDLSNEELQSIQLDNIQREKQQAKDLSKLK